MTGIDYSEGNAGLTDTREANAAAVEGDTEAIRAGIQETRDRISNDLDEIGERLNPHHIKEDIKDGIREATIGRVEEMAQEVGDKLNDVSYGFVGAIRENPIPAAMAGIGLAWLFMSRKPSGPHQYTTGTRSSRNLSSSGGQSEYSGSNDYSASYEQGDSYGNSQSRIGEMKDSVKETVSGVAGQAQQAVSRVGVPNRLQTMFYENPLAIAAGVAAIGLAVGLTAPATPPEQRLLGDVGEQLTNKASEVARETTEKAQHVAQRAIEQTKNIAREEMNT